MDSVVYGAQQALQEIAMNTQAPSTAWQERIADDEAARYEAYARRFADIQRRKSAR